MRVTVTYTPTGTVPARPHMAVSAHAVREEPAGGNAAPEFDVDDDNIARSVNENFAPWYKCRQACHRRGCWRCA